MPVQTYEFIAKVVENAKDGKVKVEMRNRFQVGDELEVLSPSDSFNKTFTVTDIVDEKGEKVVDAKRVQQILKVKCDIPLLSGDMLRRSVN